MNAIRQRFILYLLGCMGTRSLITYMAKKHYNDFYLGIILLLMGCGFIFIYINGSEKADSQLKWANAKVWWDKYRIIHGLLYISGGLMLLYNMECAWITIAIDTIIGLILFLQYHYGNSIQKGGSLLLGNFELQTRPPINSILRDLNKLGLMETNELKEFARANPELAFEMLRKNWETQDPMTKI